MGDVIRQTVFEADVGMCVDEFIKRWFSHYVKRSICDCSLMPKLSKLNDL